MRRDGTDGVPSSAGLEGVPVVVRCSEMRDNVWQFLCRAGVLR